MKKSNGGPQSQLGIQSQDSTQDKLILNGRNILFWKITVWGMSAPLFKFPQKKLGFEKSLIWEQLPDFELQLSATLIRLVTGV